MISATTIHPNGTPDAPEDLSCTQKWYNWTVSCLSALTRAVVKIAQFVFALLQCAAYSILHVTNRLFDASEEKPVLPPEPEPEPPEPIPPRPAPPRVVANVVLSQNTNPDATCGICLEQFTTSQKRWTHEGANGQTHDPFHKPCLATWLRTNPTCPIDRTPINPAAFTSPTNRILVNVFSAAFLALTTQLALGAIGGVAYISKARIAAAAAFLGIREQTPTQGFLHTCIGIATQGTSFTWFNMTAIGPRWQRVVYLAEAAYVYRNSWQNAATMIVTPLIGEVAKKALQHFGAPKKDLTCYVPAGIYLALVTTHLMNAVGVPTHLAVIPIASGIFAGLLTRMRAEKWIPL